MSRGWVVDFAASDVWVNKLKPLLSDLEQGCADAVMSADKDDDVERKRGEWAAYRSMIEMFELEGASE